MATLVFLSVSANFIYSLYSIINTISNNDSFPNLYFEAICMTIYFVKLGRFIENKSKDQNKDAISELVQITPEYATLKYNNEEKNFNR